MISASDIIAMYDPARWYWIVGDDETRVWSSAAAAYVPASDDAFMAWREAGASPTKIPSEDELAEVLAAQHPAGSPKPVVPQSVSRAQAKIALHRAGLLDAVKTVVSLDPEMQIWFDDAVSWERTNPHVTALGTGALALSPADIDALFIQAAGIAA